MGDEKSSPFLFTWINEYNYGIEQYKDTLR